MKEAVYELSMIRLHLRQIEIEISEIRNIIHQAPHQNHEDDVPD